MLIGDDDAKMDTTVVVKEGDETKTSKEANEKATENAIKIANEAAAEAAQEHAEKKMKKDEKVEEEKTERKRRSSKVMIEEKIQTPSLPDDVDSMHASIERDIMKQNIPVYVPYSIKYESYSRASKYRRAHTHKKNKKQYRNYKRK